MMPSASPIHPTIATIAAWTGTTLLIATPAVVAVDYGGVLSWTLWATSIAAVVILALLIPAFCCQYDRVTWRSHALCVLLFVFALYGFAQSIPIPQSILGLFASGSADAYSTWLQPLTLVPEDAKRLAELSPKVSLDIGLTRTASWTTLLVAMFSGFASMLFADRNRLRVLLIVIALTGALHAGLGIYQMLAHPDSTVWGIRSMFGGKPFGAFVNRSNAAVMLCIGLGASIGLIAWRLAALTGATLNGDRFPLTELLDVIFDRTSGFAIATGSLSAIGLLTCGSRSGLVGVVSGGLLAFGFIQSAHRMRGLIATFVGMALIVAIAMVNFDLSATSAERALNTIDDAAESSGFREARFAHWPDGLAAGIAQPFVGWGWGAYRYAYLPFQKSSHGAWFLNADNLWLEVFVETGLIGVLVAAVSIYVIIRSLLRLDSSADPIDHGLAAMGWFIVGALLGSQFFDFGLKIPANALAAGIVLSAVVARSLSPGKAIGEASSANRPAAEHFQITSNFIANASGRNRPSRIDRRHPIVLFGSMTIITILAANAFHSRAFEDAAVYMAARALPLDTVSTAEIQAIENLLEAAANNRTPRTDVLIQRSQVSLRHSRLRAIDQLLDDDRFQQKDELIAALSPALLRRFHYIDTTTSNPSESDQPYWLVWKSLGTEFPDNYQTLRSELEQARSAAVASLLASPLSAEARLAIISLDFADGRPEQSIELLKQAAILRKQNPELLLHIGDLAVEMKQYAFAASSWKRVALLKPARTPVVLARSQREPQLSANNVIPDSRDPIIRALTLELGRRNPDTNLIHRGIRILSESPPLAAQDKAAQDRLIGKLHSNLGDFGQAAKSFELASTSLPRDADLRFEHANALMMAGKLAEARQAARNGREIATDDPRFEKIIAKIAERIEQAGR